MRSPLRYERPASTGEALAYLHEFGIQTAVLAGGTDLMVALRAGDLTASRMLDVSRLPELKVLERCGEEIHLGAGLTFSEMLSSPLISQWAPVLQRAAATIGSRQIRNVATLGGNVVHCSPCADSVPALLVHEARAVLASARGERVLTLERFVRGPYRSERQPDELLIRFILKQGGDSWGDFQKVSRRKELAIARLTMACLAKRDQDGRLVFLRLALGSATPSPRRMEEVERSLLGRAPSEADLWDAGDLLAREMISASGRRSSTVYKEKAVQGLLVRILDPLVHHG
jgi:CO/xanthine dehydrogenase FAD-binding subunit